MKYNLIDPKLQWCKANLHCHTTKSDGHLTPEQIKDVYMQHGYSIVAFTDHDVLFDNSHLTDDHFVAITSTEFSITRCDGICHWPEMKTIHMNMFSPDPHINIDSRQLTELLQSKDPSIMKDGVPIDHLGHVYTKENIQAVIDKANKLGFLVQFNHPNWSLNTRDDYIDLKGLWGLETFNYLTELETGTEYCPNIYDDMLRHGHRIYCSFGDDNHNYNGGTVGSFGGFTYIGVHSLTYDNVFNALKNGVFYCSMGPVIKSLTFDSETKEVEIECSKVDRIILIGNNRRFQSIIEDGITSGSFKLTNGEEYFRITIVDKYGKRADTSAYFLDCYK